MLHIISFFRFLILKKKPTIRKLVCGLLVVLGLFICLLPTIFPKIDPNSSGDLGGATGVGKVLWPMCFMFGFVSVTPFSVSVNFQRYLLLTRDLDRASKSSKFVKENESMISVSVEQ